MTERMSEEAFWLHRGTGEVWLCVDSSYGPLLWDEPHLNCTSSSSSAGSHPGYR